MVRCEHSRREIKGNTPEQRSRKCDAVGFYVVRVKHEKRKTNLRGFVHVRQSRLPEATDHVIAEGEKSLKRVVPRILIIRPGMRESVPGFLIV